MGALPVLWVHTQTLGLLWGPTQTPRTPPTPWGWSTQTPRAPLTLVVAEHLHAGLRVGVIGRLKAQLSDAWERRGVRGALGSPCPPQVPPQCPPYLAW